MGSSAKAWLLGLVCSCGGAAETPNLAPQAGRKSGGDVVRVEGRGFAGHGALVVYVGGLSAKGIVVQSDTLVTFTTPEADATGTVEVALSFEDGHRVVLPEAFRYEDRDGVPITLVPSE